MSTPSARALAVRGLVAPVAALRVLWRFSRPHTIVATTVSIVGIYAITAAELAAVAPIGGLPDLLLTLTAGAAVNVFIVGVNQIEDAAVDRINKPHLPLPAGDLTAAAARNIVLAAGAVAVALALTQGLVELAAVGTAMAIGAAYSLPPLRLRRWPPVAAASISVVRAAVVNLGVYWHFADSLGGRGEISAVPPVIVALTLFVVPFSLAIAVLKDVPDMRGDRQFHIATFAVRLGPRRALGLGLFALTAAYLGMAVLGTIALSEANPWVFAAGHLVALAVLWRWALAADPDDPRGFTRFYMRVWALLFLEYALVPAAVLAG